MYGLAKNLTVDSAAAFPEPVPEVKRRRAQYLAAIGDTASSAFVDRIRSRPSQPTAQPQADQPRPAGAGVLRRAVGAGCLPLAGQPPY